MGKPEATARTYVYDFAVGSEVGRELLGGKGLGLAQMMAIGIPVPDGFVVTTEACTDYMKAGGAFPDGLEDEIGARLIALEERTAKRFGDRADPLLVSVRSGAAISMPGMMDTILNLGLNDDAVEGLATSTGNRRFAFDAYRRLIQMYGEVVDGVEGRLFEQELTRLKETRDAVQDVDLTAEDLEELVGRFKAVYRERTGRAFPQDARAQLERAVRAVFDSWETPRAQVYRRANGIPDDLGTAVNVVQMVFGNKGDTSGTGVLFTRDPSTGEPGLWGEFLLNAQGEDVVAGIRTPEPIERMSDRLPAAFTELTDTIRRLEEHYREMQDIEFTVEDGRLYLLQTRTGKRTAAAALRIAVDMVSEGLISREEAVTRIDAAQLDQLLHPRIDPDATYEVAARGLNASPGAATGRIVLDADSADERGRAGEDRGPRPLGDNPGRHPRSDPVARRPDGPGRDDLACGGRRPWDGQAVRRGLRGAPDRSRRAHDPSRRPRARRGRGDHDRRRYRRRDRRRRPAGRAPDQPELRDRPRLGGRVPTPSRARRTPTRPRMPRRRASSGPRGSASAAPSTCSWPRTVCPSSAR